MICNSCGKNIPGDSNFCPHCGAKTAQNKSSASKIVLIVAVILLAAAAATLVAAISGKKDAPDSAAVYVPQTSTPTAENTPAAIIPPDTQPDIAPETVQPPPNAIQPAPETAAPVQTLTPTDTPETYEEPYEDPSYYFQSDPLLEDKIQSIRDRFYYTQSILSICEVKYYGTSAEAYYEDGELIMLREYSDDSDGYRNDYFTDCQKYFYFDEYEVYFIYICSDLNGEEYRAYYNDGKLLRWISPDGEIFDSPYDCTYAEYSWDYFQELFDYAQSQCLSVY